MDTSATRQPIIIQFLSKYLSGEIGIFAVKAVIAAVVMLGSLAIGASILVSSLDRTLQRTVETARAQLAAELPKVRAAIRQEIRIGGRGFWVGLEDELDRLAKSDDPPAQKKQKVLSDLRAISAKWRPFLVEAAAVITGDEIPNQKNLMKPADQ